VREESMFDGIVLRAAGRVMGDMNDHVDAICHTLKFLFEDQPAGIPGVMTFGFARGSLMAGRVISSRLSKGRCAGWKSGTDGLMHGARR
jgi:hypothetical protein